MEIFLDGGLFEFLMAVLLGNLINLVFRNRYLLLVYSVMVVLTPLLLFFVRDPSWAFFLISLALVNALLLVTLLWKEYLRTPAQPLVNLTKFKHKFSTFFPKRLRNTKQEL